MRVAFAGTVSTDPATAERGGFYVSVLDADRRSAVLALGPFETHAGAKEHISRVRSYVSEHDRKGWWYAYGTSRVLDATDRAPGKLNGALGMES